MPESWTFAIATNGVSNLYLHNEIVMSIRNTILNLGRYEIIFCTENDHFKRYYETDTKTFYIENQKSNWITKKKNAMTQGAMCENICFMHDYIKLDEHWYNSYEQFGYDWDVCTNKVIKMDGSRYWDWASLDHPNYGHSLIPYEEQSIKANMYVSGAFFCAKRSFMLNHLFNEDLLWGQSEDVEWSLRCRNHWNLKFNNNGIARILKHK